MDKEELHRLTRNYIENTSTDKRKEEGQFFTNRNLCDELLDKIPKQKASKSNLEVLDPASGTGEFLYVASKKFNSPKLCGWEKDKELVEISRKVIPKARIINVNSLKYKPDKKFDLVIGNPPYYEINLGKELENKYEDIIFGRTNIYSLFIYKGIQLLKNDGYLAYIVPPSMNNGYYFKKLRDYILKKCSIEHMTIKKDSELFEGANQPIMLLVLKKGGGSRDYVFERGSIKIFSENYKYLRREFKDKKSLSELGYKARTGRVTWNENKEKLRESKTEDSCILIWSKNISKNTLDIGCNVHDKPQYIVYNNTDTGPAIVVNRVVGQPGQGEIKAAYVKEDMEFVAENHVNVIKGKDKKEKSDYMKILKQLNNEENIKIVQSITGNSQISKTELEELFPFDS